MTSLSAFVRTCVEETDNTTALILLSEIDVEELDRVLVFVDYYLNQPFPELVPKNSTIDLTNHRGYLWYVTFLEMPEPPTSYHRARFLKLFAAAEYLEIVPLSTLCMAFMASHIRDKSYLHIRTWFGIQTRNTAADDDEATLCWYVKN